jgi:hypothetical protein
MDATHPQHNPVLGGGWIKRGRCFPLKSNTGRRRLNINGAIDVETMHAVVRYDDTVDAESTIALFEQIEAPIPRPRPSPSSATTRATTAPRPCAPIWSTRGSICSSYRRMRRT